FSTARAALGKDTVHRLEARFCKEVVNQKTGRQLIAFSALLRPFGLSLLPAWRMTLYSKLLYPASPSSKAAKCATFLTSVIGSYLSPPTASRLSMSLCPMAFRARA